MVEEMRRQMQPHISSGLLVPVLDTAELAIFRLADTGYLAFCDEAIHSSTGLYIGFNLYGSEFDMLMHKPYKATFMHIVSAASGQEKNRAVVLTSDIVKKFTELKNRVAAMEKNPYINFALEAELIEISKKALATKKKWWQK